MLPQWFERASALPEASLDDVAEALFGAAENHVRAGDFARARDIYERLTRMPDPLVALQAATGFEEANWRPGLADTRAADLVAAAIDRVRARPRRRPVRACHRHLGACSGLRRTAGPGALRG